MKKFVAVLLLIVVIAVVAPFLYRSGDHQPTAVKGLPWQIETLPGGGSRVFGLTLGKSTLADARDRFGPGMEVAIIAAPGEAGSLEAYYNNATAGVLTGKMVLVAGIDRVTLQHLERNAVKTERIDTGALQFVLSDNDLPTAYRAPITTITFIPSVTFGEDVALRRFGQPAERIRTAKFAEHFLYPDKGLDLILNSKGKEILQYVAPREFARLRDPLLKATQPGPRQH